MASMLQLPGPAQKDVEKDKAVNHGKLTFVHIRNQTFCSVHHKKKTPPPFHRRRRTPRFSSTTKRYKKSANDLDTATYHH